MSENNINKSTDLNLGKENKRKKLLISFFGTIGIIGAGFTAYWIMYSSNFVSTDNAYSAVEIAQVTPSIGGTINDVWVTDTQMVKKGDILVTIDQTDTRLALDLAEANLSSAIRKVKGFVANNDSLNALIEVKKADEIRINAQLNSAKADFERASIDLQRREALVNSGAISGDELTNAKNAYSNAKANLDSAKAAIDQAKAALNSAIGAKDANEVLIAGVIDARNIWKSNFQDKVELLNKVSEIVNKENIIVSTSCSLLHVPFTLKYEDNLDKEIKSWLAFANEKLQELSLVSKQFFDFKLNLDEISVIRKNAEENNQRKISSKIHNIKIQDEIKNLKTFERADKFQDRIKVQKEFFNYDFLTTTTIGSFPQTPEIRENRKNFKANLISKDIYEQEIKKYIDDCVAFQDEIGLDVLVHGEPERNDMVEYFGEMLDGFAFTQNAWVQSYGSRCVKPPLIYGDVNRENPMTVEWIRYAQSKTKKVMKGMLTGPVTILNWSFVRDDISRSEVTKQIAFAISKEVNDLQNAGIKMIQVDEAAFKEGYPLRIENMKIYAQWAVENFKLSVSSAVIDTQIHTHMCYSEFNDIIKTIEAMDADVISIETARSGNRLLRIFKDVAYKQEIGPGIYDIHSPRVPSVEEMVLQIKSLLEVLPKEQLWINPDCGLKTRKWPEVKESLKNMVKAVNIIKKGEVK